MSKDFQFTGPRGQQFVATVPAEFVPRVEGRALSVVMRGGRPLAHVDGQGFLTQLLTGSKAFLKDPDLPYPGQLREAVAPEGLEPVIPVQEPEPKQDPGAEWLAERQAAVPDAWDFVAPEPAAVVPPPVVTEPEAKATVADIEKAKVIITKTRKPKQDDESLASFFGVDLLPIAKPEPEQPPVPKPGNGVMAPPEIASDVIGQMWVEGQEAAVEPAPSRIAALHDRLKAGRPVDISAAIAEARATLESIGAVPQAPKVQVPVSGTQAPETASPDSGPGTQTSQAPAKGPLCVAFCGRVATDPEFPTCDECRRDAEEDSDDSFHGKLDAVLDAGGHAEDLVPQTALAAPIVDGESISTSPVWRAWVKTKADASGHFKKKPCDKDGKGLEGWQNMPALSKAEALSYRRDGVGILLLKDPSYTAIDIDRCMSPEGVTVAAAQGALEAARKAGAYIERSPSGTGVHIVGRGTAAPFELTFKNSPSGVINDLASFLTITGDGASGDVELSIDALMERIRRMYTPAAAAEAVPTPSSAFTRDEVLGAAKRLGIFKFDRGDWLDVKCPWSAGHGEAGRGDDLRDASIKIKDGRAAGFKCFHGSCSTRTLRHVMDFLGLKKEKHASKAKPARLVDIAKDTELFVSLTGDSYATVGKETLAISGRAFRAWLSASFFKATGETASGSALADACTTLVGIARASGKVIPVHVRSAAGPDFSALDLGRDDRLALVVDAAGWRVGSPPDSIRFVRSAGMLPLPDPQRGEAKLSENLKKITNVSNGDDLMMLTAWLVACLRGIKPFPILAVKGEQGTAKSTGCGAARSILDPSTANLSLTPKEPRDLMIAALNSYVLAYDNLSFIPDWLSDSLSALSTGSGFRTRALHTDAEESIFSAARPVILNGIPDVVQRGDLADRALIVELDPITPSQRLTTAEVDEAFKGVKAAVLAQLADAVHQAIKTPVRPKDLPRMADFACTIASASPALGWEPEAFLKAYEVHTEEKAEALLDGDPLFAAIDALGRRMQGDSFDGSSDALLSALQGVGEAGKLPQSAKGLIAKLRRLAPALRARGFTFQAPKRGTTRASRARVCSLLFPGQITLPGR